MLTRLSRSDLKKLAQLRLTEAEHLYSKGLYDGCVYLCGYVVEFALKARICKVLRLAYYPYEGEAARRFKTHDIPILQLFAGLKDEITVQKNPALYANWSVAAQWNPEQRYSPVGTSDQRKAREVIASIKNKPNGVLTWLSKRW